jgi:AcrR family transcriptional regulator
VPTSATKTSDRRRRGTRAAILARATELARSDGLEGLTIGRLAGEMKMSKSGLFRHFGSKEELQLATIDAAAREYVEQVVEPALEQPEGRPRLEALCDHYLAHLEQRVGAGGCFWAACAAEFDDRPGPVRDRVEQMVAAWVSLLRREAKLAGAEDPEQLAFELHSLVMGANLHAQLLGEAPAFARARVALKRLLP